ncbi:shikimate kinase [Prevotellaceae bacterium HUN156]|nr:shikimate kinase [Prevotellaceae bacterium HUN156]
MRRIILVGYMGSGKTTVGKALSKEMGIMFYDLDWYIESRMRKTVSELFAERGEEAFRKIEYNMLHEVAEFEDVIISCGGGTPCFFDNMDYLNQQGDVVYLKATPETLYKHLLMAKVERPLLKGKSPEELIAYITEHLKEREPFYQKARHTVDVTLLDNYDKINITVEKIKEQLFSTRTK